MRWRPAIGASVRDCAACRRAPKVTLGTTRGRQASREPMAPRVGGLATTPLAARHRPPRGPRLTEDFRGIFQPRTAFLSSVADRPQYSGRTASTATSALGSMCDLGSTPSVHKTLGASSCGAHVRCEQVTFEMAAALARRIGVWIRRSTLTLMPT